MKLLKYLWIAFFAAVVLWACKPAQSQTSESPELIDETASNVKVSAGQDFELTFKTNASTGYMWQWTNSGTVSIVDSVGDRYYNPAPQGMVGGSVYRYWRFKAVKKGVDTLRFVYIRPWQPEQPAKTREVVVEVK